MEIENILDLIEDLTTLSLAEKEEMLTALENGAFNETMNEQLQSAIEEQMQLWEEEQVRTEEEVTERDEEVAKLMQAAEEEHKSGLKNAYQTVKINIQHVEQSLDDSEEEVIHDSEMSEADAIRAKLGIK